MGGLCTSKTIAAYDAEAELLCERYESLDATIHQARFADLLPRRLDLLALDVGAGSGRDAAWLTGLGFSVVAAEPSAGMRRAGQARHSEAPIRWIDDRLPGLEAVHALGLSFDFILLSAVWQHVSPLDRRRAFRVLTMLLKPGAVLTLTLRHGPAPSGRPMHRVSLGEIESLAREYRLHVDRVADGPDVQARPGVSWTTVCMTLPDDGGSA
jgi:SAM-dependent methyltransferase